MTRRTPCEVPPSHSTRGRPLPLVHLPSRPPLYLCGKWYLCSLLGAACTSHHIACIMVFVFPSSCVLCCVCVLPTILLASSIATRWFLVGTPLRSFACTMRRIDYFIAHAESRVRSLLFCVARLCKGGWLGGVCLEVTVRARAF